MEVNERREKASERLVMSVVIGIVLVPVVFAMADAVDSWSSSRATVAAMENGYVQQVVDGEKIWVKAEE
jgi:hypothetical protein